MERLNSADYDVHGMGLRYVKDIIDTSNTYAINNMEGSENSDCTDTVDGSFDFEEGLADIDILLMVI